MDRIESIGVKGAWKIGDDVVFLSMLRGHLSLVSFS